MVFTSGDGSSINTSKAKRVLFGGDEKGCNDLYCNHRTVLEEVDKNPEAAVTFDYDEFEFLNALGLLNEGKFDIVRNLFKNKINLASEGKLETLMRNISKEFSSAAAQRKSVQMMLMSCVVSQGREGSSITFSYKTSIWKVILPPNLKKNLKRSTFLLKITIMRTFLKNHS
ncbi:MAG: hypothetical protein ACJAW3_000992 [Lentimonas sp.]|jgi:hypothetical protein